MDTAIVVFTRDLRLHDNPALFQASSSARQVVPLFVVDPAIRAPANRAHFLAEALAELREALRELGSDLVIREGDTVAEVIKLAREVKADGIWIAGDVSRFAARRHDRLAAECEQHRIELTVTPGVTVMPPTALTPAGGGHYRVFTPYWRAWRAATWRKHCPVPQKISTPAVRPVGQVPAAPGGTSPDLIPGGEKAGRQRFVTWRKNLLEGYAGNHDDLAGDKTSRLSAYLRFGCVSPLEVAIGALDRPGGEEFCRQLAWRDFYYQVTASFPDIARKNYRPGPSWHTDQHALDGWREGQTGIPIVDAGMRQLQAEGWMHNRARMITASFLTRNLGIDWRDGYRHFDSLLLDGDVGNDAGNWQWVAGTGNNTRPNRVMNPLRQAQRFDKGGEYVRRYVPELAGLDPSVIHTPWKLDDRERKQLGYPDPMVELS
jgi:deoxyribodipyrimidine photo-lyase